MPPTSFLHESVQYFLPRSAIAANVNPDPVKPVPRRAQRAVCLRERGMVQETAAVIRSSDKEHQDAQRAPAQLASRAPLRRLSRPVTRSLVWALVALLTTRHTTLKADMRVSVAAGLTAMVAVPQAVLAEQYTVWASVIFARTGDRTPQVLGFSPTTLTSLGAQQQYHSGAFFRERYIDSTTNANVLNSAPLSGLSADWLDSMQVYIQSLDVQYTVASAQAFLQGLYPPFTLNTSATTLPDSSILANRTYVDYPLQGYQYAQIHAPGALDADYPYIAGNLNCPAFNDAAFAYENSAAFNATQTESSQTYEFVGPPLLSSVLNSDAWDYVNAYAIYDYINYQYAHNATAKQILDQPGFRDQTDNTSFLTQLRFYADQQQWAELGNLTVENTYSTGKNDPLPANATGSISTIAGNMLAAKMLAQLQIAVSTAGEYYKLSLIFGDYDPLVSLFALTGLPNIDSNFYGLPAFGSVASFELFSYTNGSNPTFPSASELWVRFYFRNGTEGDDVVGNNYQSYPIFNRGPSQTDMTWDDFQAYMNGIMVGDIGDW